MDETDKFTLKKPIERAIFPSCQSELHQHKLCISNIANLWSRSHLSVLSELSPLGYEWRKENNKYSSGLRVIKSRLQ